MPTVSVIRTLVEHRLQHRWQWQHVAREPQVQSAARETMQARICPPNPHVAVQVCPGHVTSPTPGYCNISLIWLAIFVNFASLPRLPASAPQATMGTEDWRPHLVNIRVCVSFSLLLVPDGLVLLSLHAHPQSTFTAITISTCLKCACEPHSSASCSTVQMAPQPTPLFSTYDTLPEDTSTRQDSPRTRVQGAQFLVSEAIMNPKSQTSPFDHPGHLLHHVLPLKLWFWFPMLGL
jgi:hypothetical protein